MLPFIRTNKSYLKEFYSLTYFPYILSHVGLRSPEAYTKEFRSDHGLESQIYCTQSYIMGNLETPTQDLQGNNANH